MELHCPKCGAEIEKGIAVYYDGVGTGYETKCKKYKVSIFIEDRSSYEQEGTVEIILK